MLKIERALRRAFPDHAIVKSNRGHFKIYCPAGCLVSSTPSSPGEWHWMINTRQEVRRHVCPALVTT